MPITNSVVPFCRREAKHITVSARVRPPQQGESVCLRCTSTEVALTAADGDCRSYSFQHVFPPEASQVDVFAEVAENTVKDIFSGYHGVIFVYGQTGSGKTHTLCSAGSRENCGILPRSVKLVFDTIAGETDEFTCSLSLVQLYQETFQDLLTTETRAIQLRDDPELDGGVVLDQAVVCQVQTAEQCMEVYQQGEKRRACASTLMNERSSRSHTIFVLNVTRRASDNTETCGRLILVDLAGSERAKKAGTSGERLEEAKFINSSLLVLGRVVHALTDPHCTHVPFRDSKLTRYLQYSLSGNGKTSIIVTLSPSTTNAEESHGTLLFGQRAMKVKQNAKVHQKIDYRVLSEKYKAMLETKTDEIRQDICQQFAEECRANQLRIAELESMLQGCLAASVEAEALRVAVRQQHEQFARVNEENEVLGEVSIRAEESAHSLSVENRQLAFKNQELQGWFDEAIHYCQILCDQMDDSKAVVELQKQLEICRDSVNEKDALAAKCQEEARAANLKVQALTESLMALRLERCHMNQEIVCTAASENATATLVLKDEELTSLRNTVSKQDEELSSLKSIVTEKDSEIMNLKANSEEKSKERQTLLPALDALREAMVELQQQLTQRETELEAVGQQLEAYHAQAARIKQLESDAATVESSKVQDSSKESSAASEVKIAEQAIEIQRLKDLAASLQAEQAVLHDKASAHNDTIALLELQIAEHATDNERLNDVISTLRAEQDLVKSKTSSCENSIAALELQIAAHLTENNRLNGIVASVRAEQEAAQNQESSQSLNSVALKAELAVHVAEIQRLNDVVTTLRANQENLSATESQKVKFEDEVRRLQDVIDTICVEKDILQKRQTAEVEQVSASFAEAQESVRKLTAKCSYLESHVYQIVDDLQAATTQLQQTEQQNLALTERNAYLTDELDALQQAEYRHSGKKHAKSDKMLVLDGTPEKPRRKAFLGSKNNLKFNTIALLHSPERATAETEAGTNEADAAPSLWKGSINKSRSGKGVSVVFTDQQLLGESILPEASCSKSSTSSKERSRSIMQILKGHSNGDSVAREACSDTKRSTADTVISSSSSETAISSASSTD